MFTKMIKAFYGATLAAILAAPVMAADYFYDHNGSQMRVNVQANEVRIYYQRPRAGLSDVGVQSGRLLFNGTLTNGYLEGMSRIFNANCGEVSYFVYGDFKPGRTFTLSGAAPVLSNVSCRIVDNVYEGPNANLKFRVLGDTAPSPQPQHSESGCVTGVNKTLNVRVGPGADYGRIGELRANTCGIEILDRCQQDWCAIRHGDVQGWVSMRFVQR